MAEWQITSLLLALHNIANGIGTIAIIFGVYLVVGPIGWKHYK